MDLWDQEDVDLVAPGFIEFGADHRGRLGFIAVQGGIDWRGISCDGQPGAEFTWEGFDEGPPVSGRGWAVVEKGRFTSRPYLLSSPERFRFRAERTEPSRARGRT